MNTKILSGGTKIPYRIWQYVLSYSFERGYVNIPLLANKRLDELSDKEFWELYNEITQYDLLNFQIK